jgi:hypothetical protein
MYTEGFEGLEEAEKESHRPYGVSSDVDRLQRENEKLKKSLEKEQFFNKLLDQEIQELKSSGPNAQANYPSDYWSGGKRVSRSAFYTLLFITLAMAAYIGYGIYYDKKFDYLDPRKQGISFRSNAEPNTEVTDNSTTPVTAQTEKAATSSSTTTPPASASVPPPAVKDSVPNIIGTNKNTTTEKPSSQQKASVATPDEEYNEDEVNATLREPIPRIVRPAPKPAASSTLPSSTSNQPIATSNQPVATSTRTATAVTQPATTPGQTAATNGSESKPVVGRYRISSKANFYNAPDENTMRSTFISESSNKVVNALEDKNGFIFVEYTNDLGFTSKGWLSKKDLTKE